MNRRDGWIDEWKTIEDELQEVDQTLQLQLGRDGRA